MAARDLYVDDHQLLLALNVSPVGKSLRRVALVFRPIQIIVVLDVRAIDKTAMANGLKVMQDKTETYVQRGAVASPREHCSAELRA
jgi:hypothetical protein